MRVCTFRIFMEQRVVTHFLTLKGLYVSAITAKLGLVYETETFTLFPVKRWRICFTEGRTSSCDDSVCEKPLTNDFAEAISSMLKERLDLSCKFRSRHFRIAKGTCLRILHDTLGMKSAIFVGFPMTWTRISRPKESLYSMEFLRYYRAFVLLVSIMSSLEMNHDSFCIIPVIRCECRHEMRYQKKSVKIDTEKCLISFPWPVSGTHSLAGVPKVSTYNSIFFRDTFVPSLFDGMTLHSRQTLLKGLYILLYNACPHNARWSTECLHAKEIRRTPEPVYSPDLATSDFLPFGYIRRKLTKYDVPNRQSTKRAITHIFDEIRQETPIAVFETWINRIKWVIKHKGEYFHQ
jgi:hypothetical protein